MEEKKRLALDFSDLLVTAFVAALCHMFVVVSSIILSKFTIVFGDSVESFWPLSPQFNIFFFCLLVVGCYFFELRTRLNKQIQNNTQLYVVSFYQALFLGFLMNLPGGTLVAFIVAYVTTNSGFCENKAAIMVWTWRSTLVFLIVFLFFHFKAQNEHASSK